ncbi:MAG: MMPL family transporter [Solirubrobacteraceae bacterium]
MRALARICFAHRRAVVALWLVALVALTALHGAAGSAYRDSFRLPGTESASALGLLRHAAPRAAGDSERIVVAVERGRVTDPAVRARVQAMLARVSRLRHVASVRSPYAPGARGQISRDGRVAYATVGLDAEAPKVPVATSKRLIATARSAAGDGLQVELGGQAIAQARGQGPGGTAFGFLAAAAVLLLVFGSLLTALLPLATAALSLGAGIALIGLLSHVLTIASFASELSLLIGLGVGVDYALFIVTRYRQELMRGRASDVAAVNAVDTAGRAVLFAGITVCIALLGMFALGVSFLYGVAVAASIVVACTVVAALTLLPALLGFLGPRALARRQRRALAAGELTTSDESPAWARWADRLQRRPLALAAAAALLMVVLAAPFASVRLGSTDQGSDPAASTTRKAYDLLARGFGPGFNGPLQLVTHTSTPAQTAAFARVVAAAGRTPGVVAAGPPVALGRGVTLAQVVPRGSPQDASTTDLLHALRDRTVPAAARGEVRVLVGGQTAIFNDFAAVLGGKLPLFVGVVVALSFLLLMAVFRSLAIPAMAAVMNLLSIGAAFGVVVAVFQFGWGSDVIGVTRAGPIEAFLPVMVFAILFGLSMDYEVFLVARIYEEWHRRGDNREAVAHGLAATGRTITAAAAIMVLVFAAFVLGGERIIKLFGIGLASAVLLDAIVVRSVLVPGLMLVVGRANWWLPGAIDRRLPRFNVEGAEGPV